jgi:AraC-like DNA-binding protein
MKATKLRRRQHSQELQAAGFEERPLSGAKSELMSGLNNTVQVTFTPAEPELASYVALVWTFESSGGIPLTDSRLIVPDGRAKIIIPYRGAVSATANGQLMRAKEQQVFLVGIQSNAVTIGSSRANTGSIGVELTAKGLYNLFNLRMHEVANRLVSFEDLFGAWGVQLQQWVGDAEEPEEKIALLQRVLAQLLHKRTKQYSVLDSVLDDITKSHGNIAVHTIQNRTGYSKRYLDMLFKEHVGVSPKAYAGIVRFQRAYQIWMHGQAQTFSRSHLGDYYYDQSHFIKDFKRFTGFTPQRYRAVSNEFGRAFSTEY